MRKRNKTESMEVLPKKEEEKSPEEEKEKSPEELMEIIEREKKRAEEIAREDKKLTAWNVIDLQLLLPEALDAFKYIDGNNFVVAQEKLLLLKEVVGKMRESKIKRSNDEFRKAYDNIVALKIVEEEEKRQQEGME